MSIGLGVVVVLALGASVYHAAALAAALRYRRRKAIRFEGELPPVSILKPLRGAEAGLIDNVRSHARLDYPRFEILFGAADAEDPAWEAVDRLRSEFPELEIRNVVCGAPDEGNPKTQILEQLAEQARFDLLLVDDADVAVDAGFLREAVAALDGPGVVMATAPYRARPAQSAASRVDAAWVNHVFSGQVLMAEALQGIRFGLGAAMAFRRADLDRIGGFRAIRPYLGDDYELGARMSAAGGKIVLTASAVETNPAPKGWRDVWKRHVRWARTIRVSRPLGHAGLIWTQATVWALALAPAQPVWATAVLALRIGAGVATARALGAAVRLTTIPSMIAADLLGFGAWAASFFVRTVEWRGKRYSLDRSGRMKP